MPNHFCVSFSFQVEEIQGLYGPFSISEKVLQQIWRRDDFSLKNATCASGKSLRVLDCGRWNLNEGPDFREARLEIGGVEIVGDVEIHFSAEDWFAHGHDRDSNFDRVVLDVVLFEPRKTLSEYHVSGALDPEVLVLLPLIDLDLEAYALEDALLESTGADVPAWFVNFLSFTTGEREEVLRRCALERFEQKVRFAAARIDSVGWERACHQMTLEVLGYARNRESMHRIASHYSIADFARMDRMDEVFSSGLTKWRLQGIRPANHPLRRLEQYRSICQSDSAWPDRLKQVIVSLPNVASKGTSDFRRLADLPSTRKCIQGGVFSDEIGASRLNTLMCDAVLPLSHAAGLIDAESYWLHWHPGDTPEMIKKFLRSSGVLNRASPMSVGLVQGALQYSLRNS